MIFAMRKSTFYNSFIRQKSIISISFLGFSELPSAIFGKNNCGSTGEVMVPNLDLWLRQPGKIGIAYHLFRIYVGNLCGCGMNEMDGNDLTLNGLL